ncbi:MULTISPECIES: HlyD family type I secretion periplasmic adaptor subunit [unclassified Modicisalibacter]|uniref:HlyD family type I secretion periplasmic adaptor subunit n=1 Tax=unclassified Modicisalibacter TaxID=2679913 RepID=UPI001CCA48F8|nr:MULTISPECIES: HlyD family type I secretion periplasmic adaptor subunit [unclassified Modicisalibacter]MBZ9557626.1 HlyD family type I secretion periplasmic adaptor subunit [Modicisalibacter sp. R2A 31.J]MBZ9573710.1 HlyD family type I secretion periplasmic adaptor subunit [Modicisalibacter sp. MOD 31.J]
MAGDNSTSHDITPYEESIEGESVSREPGKKTLPINDRGYRRLGLLILLIAFGGFGGWAATADLAVSVVAPGSVSVESFKKTVQHLEGGIVKDILVEDGDHVDAGQTLMVLDKTQARSQLEIARSQYLINRAAEVRLMAEQKGADALDFPEELLDSDAPRVKEVLAVQRALFQARRESLQGTLDALDEQANQMREQIDGLQKMIKVNQSRMASLQSEARDYRALFKEGLGDNQRLRELERQVLQFKGEIAQHRSEIAKLKSQISENKVQQQVKQQEFQKEVGEQLREAQANIADAEERMTALSDQVKRTTVTAPVAGTVVGMTIHTIGAVVKPGEPIMNIVPSGDDFVVEARIPSKDIDNIYPGQYAEIRFSAFNQRLTNVIEGEVTNVSADTFKDEATGTQYYKARVKVTPKGKREMTENMQLLAGMPAEVMIRTGERTFASYVAKPITDMLARAMREE